MNTTPEFSSFTQFWPYYLRAHLNSTNRLLHLIGGFFGYSGIVLAFIQWSLWPFVIGLTINYCFAWAGHGIFEKNKPLTWKYAGWSLFAGGRLFLLILFGRLDAEFNKFEIKA